MPRHQIENIRATGRNDAWASTSFFLETLKHVTTAHGLRPNALYQAIIDICPLRIPISPFFFMNRLLCRKFMGLGASQLLKPALPREAAIYATVQFPRHSSTVPPAPVDRIRHDIGEKSPTITEVVGLSGRPYLILQVLQEREPPTRRVYLARYTPAKLNYHRGLFSDFQIQRWGGKVHIEGCLPVRIQVLRGHIPCVGQLSICPPITRHDPRAVDVRLQIPHQRPLQRPLEPGSKRFTNCTYEANTPGCTARPRGAARSKHCSHW